MPASSGLDHIIIGVADLEASAALWRRLGFTVTPRGRHIGWGTANYCVMFPDDYVELLGILDPEQYVYGLDRFLEDKGEGLLGLALATQEPEAVYRALEGIGEAGDPPKDLARLLELPEGTVTPRFHLVYPRDPDAFGFSTFFCKHLTPDLVRRADWLTHPNGATGLHEIALRVPDPGRLASSYEAVFGPGTVAEVDAGIRVSAGSTVLRFAAGTPAVEHLTIAVGDLSAMAGWLNRVGLGAVSEDNATRSDQPISGIDIRFVAA